MHFRALSDLSTSTRPAKRARIISIADSSGRTTRVPRSNLKADYVAICAHRSPFQNAQRTAGLACLVGLTAAVPTTHWGGSTGQHRVRRGATPRQFYGGRFFTQRIAPFAVGFSCCHFM
jgi:hypothetical protein